MTSSSGPDARGGARNMVNRRPDAETSVSRARFSANVSRQPVRAARNEARGGRSGSAPAPSALSKTTWAVSSDAATSLLA